MVYRYLMDLLGHWPPDREPLLDRVFVIEDDEGWFADDEWRGRENTVEYVPAPQLRRAVEAERERIVALILRELDHELRTLADRIAAGGQ